jgi:hypothetical protein
MPILHFVWLKSLLILIKAPYTQAQLTRCRRAARPWTLRRARIAVLPVVALEKSCYAIAKSLYLRNVAPEARPQSPSRDATDNVSSITSVCGASRHFTAQRKSVGIGGIAKIDQAAPSNLDLSACAPVMMMTCDRLPQLRRGGAPDVVNVLDPARCETDSRVGQTRSILLGAGSTARLSARQ